MKQIAPWVCALLVAAPHALRAKDADPPAAPHPTVAVLDFEIPPEERQACEWAAGVVADLLQEELGRRGVVTVDRDLIRAVFQEQRLVGSGLAANHALTTSRLLGANFAVTGAFVPLDANRARLDVRILRVDTGETTKIASSTGSWRTDLQSMVQTLAGDLLAAGRLGAATLTEAKAPPDLRPEALMMVYEGVAACSRGLPGTGIAFFIDAQRQDSRLAAARAWEVKAYQLAGLPEDSRLVAAWHGDRLKGTAAQSATGNTGTNAPARVVTLLPLVTTTAARSILDRSGTDEHASRLLIEKQLLAMHGIRMLEPKGLWTSVAEADLRLSDRFAEEGVLRYGRWLVTDALVLCRLDAAPTGELEVRVDITDPLTRRCASAANWMHGCCRRRHALVGRRSRWTAGENGARNGRGPRHSGPKASTPGL